MSFLKNKPGNPRHILGTWPFMAAIAVALLNIDFVVVPSLLRGGFSGFRLFLLAGFLSTAELVFWYWFWGWLIKKVIRAKDVRESIDFGKQIGSELKKEGYIERVKMFFVQKFYWAINRKNRIAKMVKTGGAFSMILIGAFPEPGTRIIGIVFCRTTRWKKGFYFLAIGNILHLSYIVGGWSSIFSLFQQNFS